MTHVCCPSCRLRFTSAAAAHLERCPACGAAAVPGARPEQVLGFRLFTMDDLDDADAALSIEMPIPDPSVTPTSDV